MSDRILSTATIGNLYATAYAWRTVDHPEDGQADLSAMRESQGAEFDAWFKSTQDKIADLQAIVDAVEHEGKLGHYVAAAKEQAARLASGVADDRPLDWRAGYEGWDARIKPDPLFEAGRSLWLATGGTGEPKILNMRTGTVDEVARMLWDEVESHAGRDPYTWDYVVEQADKGERDYADIRADYLARADTILNNFKWRINLGAHQ